MIFKERVQWLPIILQTDDIDLCLRSIFSYSLSDPTPVSNPTTSVNNFKSK